MSIWSKMEDVMCVFIWARAPERRGAAFKKMWIVVSPAAYCKAVAVRKKW